MFRTVLLDAIGSEMPARTGVAFRGPPWRKPNQGPPSTPPKSSTCQRLGAPMRSNRGTEQPGGTAGQWHRVSSLRPTCNAPPEARPPLRYLRVDRAGSYPLLLGLVTPHIGQPQFDAEIHAWRIAE
jgi:hypothetical protein